MAVPRLDTAPFRRLRPRRFLVRRGESDPASRPYVRDGHLRLLLLQPFRLRKDNQDSVLVSPEGVTHPILVGQLVVLITSTANVVELDSTKL